MTRAESLLRAALAAFPADPTFPEDRQAITGYQWEQGPPGDDPHVPDAYWVPDLADAWPVARAIVHAVLTDLAENGFGPPPRDDPFGLNLSLSGWCERLASQVAAFTPAEAE